jgi:uncharacterized RDD family membrane protein YckC
MATAAPARVQTAPTEYAGFWLRVVAAIIDGVLLGVVNSVIGAFFGGGIAAAVAQIKPGEEVSSATIMAIFGAVGTMILITLAIQFVYFAYLESSEKQATVGKMVLGLKVTDMSGQRISFGRAAGRFLGKFLSSMILGIGYIMAGFTEKKQALHDMVAGTLVVRAK